MLATSRHASSVCAVRKRRGWMAPLLVALLMLAGCSERTPPAEPRRTVRVVTGIPGGGYYALGRALARAYADRMPSVDFEVVEGDGSVRTIEAIQHGDADVGFAFADAAYLASVGRLPEAREPFSRLRGISVLQLTPVHLVVGAHIRDISDLRGRRVGLGPVTSGTSLTAGIVLAAFKLSNQTFRAEFLAFNDMANGVVKGRLDAMFAGVNYPAEPVSIAMRGGNRLLPMDGPIISQLRDNYPFLRTVTIPAGVYPGQATPIRTVGVDSLLICRSDLDEELVYDLTRVFYEALPVFSSDGALRFMDLDQGPATPIPLHSGAARYFRERELTR